MGTKRTHSTRIVALTAVVAFLTGMATERWRERARPAGDQLWPAKRNHWAMGPRAGFIDSRGRFRIGPAYGGASSPSEGYVMVWDESGRGAFRDHYRAIRLSDGQVFPFGRDRPAGGVSMGLVPRFSPPDRRRPNEGLTGLATPTGEWAVEPRYDWIDSFSEGLAMFRLDGKVGYLSRSGEVAIEPRFDHGQSWREGVAAVLVDEVWGMIDRTGEWVVKPSYRSLSQMRFGLAVASDADGGHRLIDARGRTLLGPREGGIEVLGDGLIALEHGGLWALCSPDGFEITPPEWDRLGPFSEGLAFAASDSAAGYIDPLGSWQFQLPHADMTGEPFDGGLAFVERIVLGYDRHREGVEGYVNRSGRWVHRRGYEIPP